MKQLIFFTLIFSSLLIFAQEIEVEPPPQFNTAHEMYYRGPRNYQSEYDTRLTGLRKISLETNLNLLKYFSETKKCPGLKVRSFISGHTGSPVLNFTAMGHCPVLREFSILYNFSGPTRGIAFVLTPKNLKELEYVYFANSFLYIDYYDINSKKIKKLKEKILKGAKGFGCYNSKAEILVEAEEYYYDDITVYFSGICPGYRKLWLTKVAEEKVTFSYEKEGKKGTKTL